MSGFTSVPTLLPSQARDASAAGITYHIEGELVPVLSLELAPGQTVFFEHHILLWKEPSVGFGVRPLRGALKRMIAGMDLLIAEATGPGRIGFSRDGVGHVFAVVLAPGHELHVREHQFLAASSGIDFTWERVRGVSNMLLGGTGFFIDKFIAGPQGGVIWLHGHGNVFEKQLAHGEQFDVEPGGWLCKDPSVGMETNFQGLTAGFLGAQRLMCNRFTGPGRIALQSMSASVESAADDTSQPSALGGIVGGIASSLVRKLTN